MRGVRFAPRISELLVVPKLFDAGVPAIDGFRYDANFIAPEEEVELLAAIRALEFGPVVFRGVEARRRVVHFGWGYSYGSRRVTRIGAIPPFLEPVRQRAAELVQLDPVGLEEVLVTEYQPGAGIGWHRDAPPFGLIVGVSLLSACTLRLKPMGEALGRPVSLGLEPRSVYVFDGVVRSEWQHMIPPAKELRYSITFRTLRSRT